jgi:biopolymer transport protein ExbD
MPKMKVPRKSTSIDMTAMCDVAFLLLSFFIFTAKFKKNEDIEITTPNSVSTDSVTVKDKFNVYCNISKEGKVLLGFENDTVAKFVVEEMNTTRALGLSPSEIEAYSKKTSTGADFKNLKSYLSLLGSPQAQAEPDGIPLMDSSNNQLKDWIIGADKIYQNYKAKSANPNYARTVYIKADKDAPYKVVDKVMETFSKNGTDQFKLVTTPDDAPMGTALYEKRKRGE